MSLRKQTLLNSMGSLILMGSQWLISMVIVRLSGYEDAGVFALAMSISNVFASFANYGMRSYQIADTKHIFSPIQYVFSRTCLSCFAGLFCFTYLLLDSYSLRNATAVIIYLSYSLSFQISDIMMGNLQRENHLELNGYSNGLRGMLCFTLFLFSVIIIKELVYALIAMSLGSLLVLLLYDIPNYCHYCPQKGDEATKLVSAGFRICEKCFYLMISTMIPIVITAIPRREVQRQLGEKMLGYFSAVYTPMVILNTLIPSLIIALIPGIALSWKNQYKEELRKKIWKSYGIIVMITLTALAFSLVFGKTFLNLIYGHEIMPYTFLLFFSVVAIALNSACVCGSYILVALDCSKQVALYSIVSLLITIALSSSLIKSIQLYGAAYVLILAYATQMVFQVITITTQLRKDGKNEN